METTPDDKTTRQGDHFEKISPRYYRSRQSKNHVLLKDLMWGRFFRDKLFLRREGMHVLEPMCGYAEGKTILENHLGISIRYEGFDLSETLIDRARKNDPFLHITQMDVTRFEATRRYDLVLLIGGLHHVYGQAERVMTAIAASLKDDGYFINLEPTFNNCLAAKISDAIYRKNDLFDYETEKRFALRELNALYASCNLTIIDQIYPGMFSYILYYNPDAFPFLNIGSGWLTRSLFAIDTLFIRNRIGRKLSFATLTLLKKRP